MEEFRGERQIASVVVPAHNEERVITATLSAVLEGIDPDDLELIVVCNGCDDRTAAVAADVSPRIQVIEIAESSKYAAIREGNSRSTVFPRVYLDADVQLSGHSLMALVGALRDGVEAAAPERQLVSDRSSWVVRAYYEFWESLPQVQRGLFGRGVVAVSQHGHERIAALPRSMSDDLVASEAFSAEERRVVPGAIVRINLPRTVSDLVRRRIRVVTGNAQADQQALRRDDARTSLSSLGRLVLARPALLTRLPVFAAVTLAARIGSRRAIRRNDFTTWQRDESSRLD